MSVVREVPSHDPGLRPYQESDRIARDRGYEFLKRVIDICVAGAALVLLAPVLVVAAVAIKLSSPGPILYRGTVIGRHGQPFTYYKLRTMTANGDDSAHRRFIEAYVAPGSDGRDTRRKTRRPGLSARRGREDRIEEVYKLVDDPRITAVGRILRTTSLDEVAQMINVLRGEMSVVGPRPPVLYEYRLYRSHHKQRLSVLPGITGLAQVRARSRATFEEMVEIDLEYIRRRSLRADLAIMARTVWVVLSGRGAH